MRRVVENKAPTEVLCPRNDLAFHIPGISLGQTDASFLVFRSDAKSLFVNNSRDSLDYAHDNVVMIGRKNVGLMLYKYLCMTLPNLLLFASHGSLHRGGSLYRSF